MGFAHVTATLPKLASESTNPKIVSQYQKSLACLGKVVIADSYDASETRLRRVSEGISQNTAPPFTCQDTSTTTAELPDSTNK